MQPTDNPPAGAQSGRATGSLIPAAAGVIALHAAFLIRQPFNLNIPAFLFVYSLLCGLSALLFMRLRARPAAGSRFGEEAAVVVAGAVVIRLLMLATSPTLSDDVFRYVWDGRVQAAGINPFLYPPAADEVAALRDGTFGSINHPTLRTIYPPVAQFFFRIAASVRPTVFMQKVVFALFDIGLVLLLLVMLKRRGRRAAWAALYAWHPLPAVEFAGSGHVDSLMLFWWMAACLFLDRGRVVAGGMALGLAAMSKWITVVMAPWLALRGRWRGLVPFALVAAVACAPFAHGLWTLVAKFTPEASGARAYANDWVFNPGLYQWIGGIVGDPVRRKVAIGAALVVFSLWWARRNPDPARYSIGVLFALLLASPVVYPWYVVWLLPFAVLVPSPAAFVWAWGSGLSYTVHGRYAAEGVWAPAGWASWIEYGTLYAFLVAGLMTAIRRPRAPARSFPPLNDPRVGVVIPALNEEKAIGLVIGDLPRGLVHDLVVVDNGSTDGTPEAAERAGARVIREPARGYGRAVQKGIAALAPDVEIVVVLDGDRSDFPDELPSLLAPIREGRADLVIGSRTEAALPGSLMPQQRFGNWLTCRLIRLLYGHRFSDMGPFRAIRRAALDEMKMRDETFGWNVEMQVKALRMGFRAVEVPVRYRPRIGQSKISGTIKGSVRAGAIILWSIYRYGFADRQACEATSL